MTRAEQLLRELQARRGARAELDAEIDELEFELLRELAANRADEPYTQRNPPPGMSGRRFRERCAELAARGDDRVWRNGRLWVARRDAFENRATVVRAPAPPVIGEGWSARAALAEVRARPTGGRGPRRRGAA